jgi:hypothetical protein
MATVQNERGTGVRPSGDVTYGRPASAEFDREVEHSAKVVSSAFSVGWLAGAAGIVLEIIALAGVWPTVLTPIVLLVLGGGMFIKGLSVASRAHELQSSTGSRYGVLATELSAETLAGVTGIVLGVLSLVGLFPMILTAAAIIVFGAALMLTGGETFRVNQLQRPWTPASGSIEGSTRATAQSSAGGEEMIGVAAVVLGILALVGLNPAVLTAVALLAISGIMLLSGLLTNAHMAALLKHE